MKKLFKILGVSFLLIFIALLALPYLFQGQIKQMVKNYLNNSLNAQVDFDDVSLSLISGFPKASVTVDNLSITNFKPFEGEKLATAKHIGFNMPIKELFKKPEDGAITVSSIEVDEALINIKTDKQGNSNYDIFKEETENTTETENSSSFKFSIDNYSIDNSAFTYSDEVSKILLSITELNHSGKGTFSADVSELDTESNANISLSIDSTKYLNNNSVKLDALIDLDLNNNKYTFKDNKGYINQLPLEFNGFVQIQENGQLIDITFKNTGSDFKDFLAVIPEQYSKNIESVKTTGTFKVDGSIKGLVTDTTIPKLDINIASNNASFKYPDLPKTVENIIIDTKIKNETGNADDTFININSLKFKIDEDVFQSSATIKNITKNMLVDANIDGKLNLANISKAYPIELDNELNGILIAKLHTHFDMNAIETNAFNRIKNTGTISLSDFKYDSKDVKNPINISNANVEFNPSVVTLKSFDAKTGSSDLKATGTINNLLGFMLNHQDLKGNFSLNSNTFKVDDFLTEGEEESTSTNNSENLKIPAFLDCTINANANTVLYDNLTLKNVKGILEVTNQKAELKNMSSSIFDGSLTLNGSVDTKPDSPTFNMQLGINKFNISDSFKSLELFQSLAPLAKILQGKLNSTLQLSGNLSNDYTPQLSSLSGDALAELLTTKFEPKNEALFNQLTGALSFINFKDLDLKDIKTKLTFDNGKVSVKPFNLKYKDIEIVVDGSHGFDKSMNYKAVFNVPAKYLGTEVNNLIAKIDEDSAKDIMVPITATIGGSLTNPKVSTDLTSGVSNLTQQLVEIQKNKLINKGKGELSNLLNGALGGSTKTDSTITTQTKDPVKDVLNDIVGGNKKQPDSTKKTTTENAIKNVLGGLLGGNKKKKDTVN